MCLLSSNARRSRAANFAELLHCFSAIAGGPPEQIANFASDQRQLANPVSRRRSTPKAKNDSASGAASAPR